ncbi:flippase [Patescibacteria group bacterium]|nr:flippase [Patescibacteria group bacterium]MBU4389908.1 flippase [Patescibacteria group bacterium]MBU4397182.1 flippase [Patescibacteria group bacterium]MCG2701591.1 flippase [Candidatus Parcubacteria bacterium]
MLKVIKNTGVQIIGKVLTIAISLVVTGLLIRRLGGEQYGNFTLIVSILLLIDAMADLGTRMIGVREASRGETKKVFVNVFVLRILLTGVAFVMGLLLVSFYSGFEGIRTEALVALLMIWLTSLAGSLEIIFQTKMRLDLKTVIDVLFPLLFLVFLVFVKNISLGLVFGLYLVTRGVSLIVGGQILIKNYRKKKTEILRPMDWTQDDAGKQTWLRQIQNDVDWEMVKKLLREAWPMGLYLIIFTSYDKAVDSAMIKHFLGAGAVAWYGLGYKIYSSLVMPAYFFVSSIFPILSRGKGEEKRIYKQGGWILAGMALLGAPFIYIFAPMAINVLSGGEFVGSIVVLRILILALIVSYINHLNGFTLISRGKQKMMLKLGVVSLLFNIGANLVIIPLFGINGAAWVTVGTEVLIGGLMGIKLNLKSKIQISK